MAADARRARFVVVVGEPTVADAPSWLAVGALSFRDESTRIAFVVKLSLSWSGATEVSSDGATVMRIAADQTSLTHDRPSTTPAAGHDELDAPDDFVPRKAAVDVCVVGHAKAAHPTHRIEGSLVVAGARRRFVASASAHATAIPLSLPYLSAEPFAQALGPTRARRLDPSFVHDEAFDFAAYAAACPAQRTLSIAPDERIELVGLCRDGGQLTLRLPGVAPRLVVEVLGEDVEVDLVCDTLLLDVDREHAMVTWRGSQRTDHAGHDFGRVAIWLEPMGDKRPLDELLPLLQRGTFGFALALGDDPDRSEASDEDERNTLAMARYATWGSKAPPPRLSLEQYAGVSAELAEWPDARSGTLARHGFDADTFTVEERAWLEKMADAALDGNATIADAYAKHFIAAQDALATDAERAQTLTDFAELKVAIDDAEQPAIALDQNRVTLAAWLRMERRWDGLQQRDPNVAADLERAMAAVRARGRA